jgi:hypothetical protein
MNFFHSKVANASVPINQLLAMDVGETSSHVPVVLHKMVWRLLGAFVVKVFGKLNVAPPSLTLNARCCKKTLNIITKPKSFQNK